MKLCSAAPQAGRRSMSSGRASATIRMGWSRDQVGEVLDEVEQARIGPLQVLEQEDRGRPVGDPLEERAPGGEELLAIVRRRSSSRPSRTAMRGSSQLPLVLVADELAERRRRAGACASSAAVHIVDPERRRTISATAANVSSSP